MHEPHREESLSKTLGIPSVTVINRVVVEDQSPLITPPPDLRKRDPVPQDDSCQQADQSASQAAQSASQSASQSIQQAQQSASQASREASQSASQAIQQAQQTASESIAAASRSASQAISSASSVVASVQSSAASAISRASGSMASASAIQADASSAIIQAGAAVAAATGSAAAAGESFLSAVATATQGAQASLAAIGAAAASSASVASAQVAASQTAAVTATQAAIAIVGSIIASALITILIYFLIIRHKKKVKRRSQQEKKSLSPGFPPDPKFPISAQEATTAGGSQSVYNAMRSDQRDGPEVANSGFPESSRRENVRTTSVAWNPTKPPKPPTLGSWLKVQDDVSPFGSIKLPTDKEAKSPLGGQLKSPLRSIDPQRSPKPKLSLFPNSPSKTSTQDSPIPTTKTVIKGPPTRKPISSENLGPSPKRSYPGNPDRARESKASIWTDEIPDISPSPLQSPAPEVRTATVAQGYSMKLPSGLNPVRTTAEWLESIRKPSSAEQMKRSSVYSRKLSPSLNPRPKNERSTFGLPSNPKPGIQSRFASGKSEVRSLEGEMGFVQGLDRFLPGDRTSKVGSDSTFGGARRKSNGLKTGPDRSPTSTPGVGRAM